VIMAARAHWFEETGSGAEAPQEAQHG